MDDKRMDAYRIGVGVMILLGALTIGEFFIGSVASVWWGPLMLIALTKAVFVVRYYMHLPSLFAAESEEEHA